ncbi:hypothetical protein HK100_007590 [Physocladia obscura]|uniref:GRAM domain-containing protein n=1 Tax=Physocladia obscura TaxID=109957 RepID=A0AAD5T580_9FUNG|nr:hypothetical protein HK100_007590 [Physocladia obscura]
MSVKGRLTPALGGMTDNAKDIDSRLTNAFVNLKDVSNQSMLAVPDHSNSRYLERFKGSEQDGDALPITAPATPAMSDIDEDYHLALSNADIPSAPPSLSRSKASNTNEADNEFRNYAWEKLLLNLFKTVPSDEPLFVEHNCAFQGEHILQQGKIYLTPNFFCFHANIFGFTTTFEFPIGDILYIERAKTAIIIPNAIIIGTNSKAYFFTSFINRENAYANMEYLISRYRESHKSMPLSKSLAILGRLDRDESVHNVLTNRYKGLQAENIEKRNAEVFRQNFDEKVVDLDDADFVDDEEAIFDSDKEEPLNYKNIVMLAMLVLAIALCMFLALGSSMILWKVKAVIGRLERIALNL